MRDLTQEEVCAVSGGRTPIPSIRMHSFKDVIRRFVRPQAQGTAIPGVSQQAIPGQSANRRFVIHHTAGNRHDER